MIVICLLFVVYFLKPFLFPCEVSHPAIFSHTLVSIACLQIWSTSVLLTSPHCLGSCLNLTTHFVPQWENLEPGGNGLFPKVRTGTTGINMRTASIKKTEKRKKETGEYERGKRRNAFLKCVTAKKLLKCIGCFFYC